MSVLNRQITVSKEAFEKRWDIPMNQSLQDAFNDILSNFSENEIDRSYGSPMNQFLKNDKGDIYYFDNFKYVYPIQIADSGKVCVLNNSRGSDKFCFVRYNGLSIIVENYDVNNVWYENQILKYKKDGKVGLIDFSGNQIVPAEYDKIYAMQGIQKSIIIEKDGLCGLVNNSLGEIIIEPKYAEILSLGQTYENGYIVKNTDSYYGIITTDKKEILECKYDKIYHVTGNEMYVVTEGGKDKVINKSGEEILTTGFEEIIAIETGNDFVIFEIKDVAPIAVAKKYAGIGASVVARIKNTKTPFSIDFGIGDVIVPKQEKRKIPTQLTDFDAPTVNTYSVETTIAEKIDAIWKQHLESIK